MGIVAKACWRLALSLGCGVRAESRLFARGTGDRGLSARRVSSRGWILRPSKFLTAPRNRHIEHPCSRSRGGHRRGFQGRLLSFIPTAATMSLCEA